MIFRKLISGHFDILMSQYDQVKKMSCLLGKCQNGVSALYCKEWEPRYPPNTSKRLWYPLKPLRHPQTPPDIPQTPHRHPTDTPHTSPGNTTCQQTTTDANGHRQTYSSSTCQCIGVSGSVCWHVLFPGETFGVSGGCVGGVWGYLSGIHGNRRH